MAEKNTSGGRKHRAVFHSIRLKINLAVGICGLILMIFSLWLLTDSMSYVERDMMDDRLTSDIRYLRDELGENDGAEWSVRDGALYIDDTLIGDGTTENANETVFQHCEDVTGTFFYTFVRTYNDDELTWNENGKYQEGHYMRVAGTTKGPDGENIEGTYIDKKVADILESSEDGVYSAEANVNGRMIYCRYETIRDKDGNIVGAVSNGRSAEEMEWLIHKQKIRGFILIIAAMTLMSCGLGVIVFSMLSAIKKIKKRLKLIGTGEFPEKPLVLKSDDEMSEVAQSINEMVESLREKDRIATELTLATDIQAHMLPSIFPPFPEHDEFDIYATMEPAKEVGGDFYDFFMLDDKTIAVVVADVSGKGVPAALFMVITKTLIKNHMQSGMTPAEVFTKVNQMLCEGNEAGLFVTAWIGVLDLETGKLTYVNAGHNPPLLKLGDGGFEYLRSHHGFVLAGMEGLRYKQSELIMKPGDRLFLYTDGVTETTNTQKELYGEQRLEDFLNKHADSNTENILHELRRDIDIFEGDAQQFDDITMLILDYNQKSKGETGMIEKEFSASDEELQNVLGFVEQELEKLECPAKSSMQITVAVEEIFVNIAHYAYDGKPGKMTLGIRTEEDGGILMRFSDHGMPFDPLGKTDPDIMLSADDRQIGGLGIYMVKKTMDDVKYKYENGQNVLTIVKKWR